MMAQAPTAAARRVETPDDDDLRALLELLREADEGREFEPGVRFTAGAVVLRRRDGAQVLATFGTLEQLTRVSAQRHGCACVSSVKGDRSPMAIRFAH